MKVPQPKQLPSGHWFIYLRLGGEGIGVTETTRAECVARARVIKADYLATKTIKKQALPPAPELTLRELLDAYIEKYKPMWSPATVRGYIVVKENRFQAFADMRLRDLPPWQKIINAEAKTCKPKTLKNAWALVHAALLDAGAEVPRVTLPQIQSSERPFLTAEQIRTFVDAVHGSDNEIPILMGLHGLRRSEIAAVTWDRVDLKGGVIRIEGAVVPDENSKYVYKKTNKNATSRRSVPIMIPELLAALKAVPEEDRSGPVVRCHINTIYKAVNRICEREGLPLIGAHGLRHSFASLGHRLGVPEHDMQVLGGWKDPATMRKIYEHIDAAELLAARNAMAKWYAGEEQNVNENANADKK